MQTAKLEEYGRMYAATTEGALHENIVITGTLLIHSVPALVLFDSGNTHTFLARTFVDRISFTVDDLDMT